MTHLTLISRTVHHTSPVVGFIQKYPCPPFCHHSVKISLSKFSPIFSSLNLLGTEPWIFNYLPSLSMVFHRNSRDISSGKTQLAPPSHGPLRYWKLKLSNPIDSVSGKNLYFPLC